MRRNPAHDRVVVVLRPALEDLRLYLLDLLLEPVHDRKVLVDHPIEDRVRDPGRALLQEPRVPPNLREYRRDRADPLVVRVGDEEVRADDDVELGQRERDVVPVDVFRAHAVHHELHVVAEVLDLRDTDVVPDVLHRQRIDVQHLEQELVGLLHSFVELHPEALALPVSRRNRLVVRRAHGAVPFEDQRLQPGRRGELLACDRAARARAPPPAAPPPVPSRRCSRTKDTARLC